MPTQWSHTAGLGTIGSCLEHAAASTHIWRPAQATPVLIWRGRAGLCPSARGREDPPRPAPPRACITSPHLSPPLLWPLLHPSSLAQPSSAGSRGKLLIALHQPGTGVIWRGASQRIIKRVMQRTPSHSSTQRGGHCTALSRRRCPSGPASPRAGRASPVLARRPHRPAARPRPDPARPPDPGRPEWRPEVSA